MSFRKQRVRIAKSRASKMWMESLEQRQLLSPIVGDLSIVGAGMVGAPVQRLDEATTSNAAWVADSPRDLSSSRRDDHHQASADGVVVMVL
jgi:hypothetical protein